ncbi:MAG: type II toxin-antitoxin system VapC family toxin [Verrucomicrobiae bacterium]|nr:type II toxin-antitoxin system VapC family toxin [Verrucomicrobiae bacterium]
MSGFLLDTNLLSELRKEQRCDAGVRRWVEGTSAEAMFVSVVVLGEIRRGVERIRLRDLKQARALEKWLHGIPTVFSDRVLHVDERVADQWGRLGSRQPVPPVDALLAATALVHDLTVVTRDADGFRNTGARVLNPFTSGSDLRI